MIILECEKMNEPPTGDSEIGDDGFNINLDLMKDNQQYSITDEYGDKIYFLHHKDKIFDQIMIQFYKPLPEQTISSKKEKNTE